VSEELVDELAALGEVAADDQGCAVLHIMKGDTVAAKTQSTEAVKGMLQLENVTFPLA